MHIRVYIYSTDCNSYLMLKLAIFPSSSTSFANTSTLSTISINKNIKLAMAILSPVSSSSSFGDFSRLNSILRACSFGNIKIVAWHLFILMMLSPSSLKICTSFDPTILHGSLSSCLVVDDGWGKFELNYLTCTRYEDIVLDGVKVYNCLYIEICHYHYNDKGFEYH